MKRILLFLATNVAILGVLSVVMRLLGVDSLLAEQGTRLDFRALLICSAVIGFLADRLIFRTERGYGPGFFIASIVAQIVLGILASTIVMWFSRQREFRADAGGARLAGQVGLSGCSCRIHFWRNASRR